jgi:hypothetical protein
MLDQEEAAKLIRRLERGIPKRPAAASVRRAGDPHDDPRPNDDRRPTEGR